MSSLPLPIRVAAGLAAIAVERARKLPQDVTEWPMTAVSQALQVSMRVQQRITELAIKGDEALAGLREPEEEPPWAVFDEDLPRPSYLRPQTAPDVTEATSSEPAADEIDDAELAGADTTTAAEQSWLDALDEVYGETPVEAAPGGTDAENISPQSLQDRLHGPGDEPVSLPNYRELSLASIRGRLRNLTVAELEELLAYERGHEDRPEFVRMLTNRIATVRDR